MSRSEQGPVIDEVREVRGRISARFGHDPQQIVDYYIELQKAHADRLLRESGAESRESKRAA
jgi:hypothetical protein